MPGTSPSDTVKGTPLASQVGGSHYKNFPIQPIEFCQRNRLTACQFAVIKYICRHDMKNGIQDLEKAIHFVLLLAQLEYPDQVAGLEAKVAEMLSVVANNGLQDVLSPTALDEELPTPEAPVSSLRDIEDLHWIESLDKARASGDQREVQSAITQRRIVLRNRLEVANDEVDAALTTRDVAYGDLDAFNSTFK